MTIDGATVLLLVPWRVTVCRLATVLLLVPWRVTVCRRFEEAVVNMQRSARSVAVSANPFIQAVLWNSVCLIVHGRLGSRKTFI